MKVIDADTHAVEPSSVWDFLSSRDEALRPSILHKQQGAPIHAHFAGKPTREFWVIDNDLYGKHDPEFIAGHSNGEFGPGAITLEDVPARLADMDRQRVDAQVIFSSLFLNIRCARPRAELALTRAYNRWLADRCSGSGGRLKWIFVPSLNNPEKTVRDMRVFRDQGAVGVLFRGLEGDRFLDHADFDPVYSAAVDLDLPICVHIGHGSPAFESIQGREGAGFNRFISDSPNYLAFSVLLNSKLHARFPDLRFGFFESGCSWVAAALQTALHVRLRPEALMERVKEKLEQHNFFFTCEVHEDLPRVMRYLGDDRLLASSDYGHPGDIGDTIMYQDALARRGDLDDLTRKKLVSANAHALFRL